MQRQTNERTNDGRNNTASKTKTFEKYDTETTVKHARHKRYRMHNGCRIGLKLMRWRIATERESENDICHRHYFIATMPFSRGEIYLIRQFQYFILSSVRVQTLGRAHHQSRTQTCLTCSPILSSFHFVSLIKRMAAATEKLEKCSACMTQVRFRWNLIKRNISIEWKFFSSLFFSTTFFNFIRSGDHFDWVVVFEATSSCW